MSGSNASDLIGRSPDRRKLIAVVYADMVGYSRLIGLDDAGTLERLRSLRSQLIDPAIEEHGGRIVQTGGDSLLIVFDSIDGAVRCAVEVQQQVPILDRDQPPDRAIRFRVGINIGDAIADGTDLHGDAVNVAARIQAECPPGGICVTRPVRDHVQDRLGLAFEEIGALNLKNISRPVEAFVLRFDSGPAPKVERLLVRDSRKTFPLPDRPSIAVLAFTNMSDDPNQEYFSDGIADDIITELSRDRTLFVIARNSSFTYRGRSIDVKQIGRELGVRYVLEGSVRRSSDRVRLTAQLIEAETGGHVWAERYDRSVNQVFAVQDEITAAVTVAILPAITNRERQRALRKLPGSLSAWEAYQRGLWHLSKGALVENEQARLLFRRAVKLDRGFAAPHVGLALAYQLDVIAHGVRQPVDAAKLIEAEARTAVEVDPDDSEAHAMLAIAFALTNNQDASRDCAKHALMLNRNSARAFGCRGAQRIFWSGLYEDGRNDLLTALRLDPHSPLAAANLATVAAGYYLEGDYIAAVETARRCLAVYPSIAIARRWLVAGLGQLGRHEEAAVALQALLVVAPDVFNTYVINRLPFITLKSHEHLLEGFRKAGWQG